MASVIDFPSRMNRIDEPPVEWVTFGGVIGGCVLFLGGITWFARRPSQALPKPQTPLESRANDMAKRQNARIPKEFNFSPTKEKKGGRFRTSKRVRDIRK